MAETALESYEERQDLRRDMPRRIARTTRQLGPDLDLEERHKLGSFPRTRVDQPS